MLCALPAAGYLPGSELAAESLEGRAVFALLLPLMVALTRSPSHERGW